MNDKQKQANTSKWNIILGLFYTSHQPKSLHSEFKKASFERAVRKISNPIMYKENQQMAT